MAWHVNPPEYALNDLKQLIASPSKVRHYRLAGNVDIDLRVIEDEDNPTCHSLWNRYMDPNTIYRRTSRLGLCFAWGTTLMFGLAGCAASSPPEDAGTPMAERPRTDRPQSERPMMEPQNPSDGGGDSTGGGDTQAPDDRPMEPGSEPDLEVAVDGLTLRDVQLKVTGLEAEVRLNLSFLGLIMAEVRIDANAQELELTVAELLGDVRLDLRLGVLVNLVEQVISFFEQNPDLLRQIQAQMTVTANGTTMTMPAPPTTQGESP